MTTAKQIKRLQLDRLNAILKTKSGKIMAALDRLESRINGLLTEDKP